LAKGKSTRRRRSPARVNNRLLRFDVERVRDEEVNRRQRSARHGPRSSGSTRQMKAPFSGHPAQHRIPTALGAEEPLAAGGNARPASRRGKPPRARSFLTDVIDNWIETAFQANTGAMGSEPEQSRPGCRVGDPRGLPGAGGGGVTPTGCPGTRPYPGRADHLPQVDVHPVVAADQVPVVCLPVLQLHQLQETGVTGRRPSPGTGTRPWYHPHGEAGAGPCCRYSPWGGSAPSSAGTGAAARGKRTERPQAPPGTGTPTAIPTPIATRTGTPAPLPQGEASRAFPRAPGRPRGSRPSPGPRALPTATHHRAGAAAAPGAAAQTAPGPARGQSERGAAPAEPIRAPNTVSAVKRRRGARSAPLRQRRKLKSGAGRGGAPTVPRGALSRLPGVLCGPSRYPRIQAPVRAVSGPPRSEESPARGSG